MAIAQRPDAAEATRRLFDEHARAVLAICRLTLRDRDEAEDAAQQTFLAAHRSLLNGTVPQNPGAWVAAIARNECRARLRRNGVRPLPLDCDPVGGAQDAEAGPELSESLAELPRRQREAVVLRDVYGLSHTEIATALGVNVGAVNSLLTRGRGRLRRRLGRVWRGAPSLLLPDSLRDQLAQVIPGFEASAGTASGAGAVGLAAKLASAPAAAKVAAVLGVATVGATAPQLARHRSSAPPRTEAVIAVAPESRQTARAAAPRRVHPVGSGRVDSAERHKGRRTRDATEGNSGPGRRSEAEQKSAPPPATASASSNHSGDTQRVATEPEHSGAPGPSSTSTVPETSNRGPGGGGEAAPATTTTVDSHSGPGGGGGETGAVETVVDTGGSGSGKGGSGG